MLFLKIALVAFVLLEIGNVVILYFFPDMTIANGMGAFKAWEKSKDDPQVHDLIRYLTNWVAGTKLIFLLLLLVLIFTAGERLLVLAAITLAVAISSFFFRMFPLIRKMDKEGQVDPPGYSKTLAMMIGGMIIIFILAALIAI